MSKTLLSTVMTAALLFGSSQAMAGQITGAINADNRFSVAVTNGNNVVARYDAPSNYGWSTKQAFSLSTPDDIKECRINVVVWGDNAVAEGFAGVLRGDLGEIFTGGSGSNGFQRALQTSTPSGGTGTLPSNSNIVTWTNTSASAPMDISNPTWGSTSNYYVGSDFTSGSYNNNMSWIKPQGAGKTTKNHWVFSSPCGQLVKPVQVAVDMPGDHFQCYSLREGDALKPETIYIRDQFGESKTVLGKPRMLCNPSVKVHNDKEYKVEREERHLVCYDYVKRPKREQVKVTINNQFAPDEVVTDRNRMFCVPSSKTHIK